MDSTDAIFQQTLLEGFRNPRITTLETLVTTGISYHRTGEGLKSKAQAKLIATERPMDFEPYIQALETAGIPPEQTQPLRQYQQGPR